MLQNVTQKQGTLCPLSLGGCRRRSNDKDCYRESVRPSLLLKEVHPTAIDDMIAQVNHA